MRTTSLGENKTAMAMMAGTEPMSLNTNLLAQCILKQLQAKGSELCHISCNSDAETCSPSASSGTPRSESDGVPQSPSKVPLHLANLLGQNQAPRPPPGLMETSQEPQWQLMNPSAKFKSSCGCALVSHPITVGDFEGLRVIFSPGKLWMSEYCRNTKKHKKTQVTEALPKFGSLQLKLMDSPASVGRRVFFVVGSLRVGPIQTKPGQVTTEVCELQSDWRGETTKYQGQLPIRVEVEVSGELSS